MAVKRDYKEVCDAFNNLREELGDKDLLDGLYRFIGTNELADYLELIAEDEDIYLGYDGEVDTSRPYDDEGDEDEEEE